MALGTPTLATPTVFNSSPTVASAAFTPTAGALLLWRVGTRNTALPAEPTTNNTGGLTPTSLASGLYDIGTGTRHRARAWAAVVGDTPVSMTISGASVGGGRITLSIVQITGHGGIPGNAIAADHVAGDPSMTLGTAPATSSLVLLFYSASGLDSVTSPAGFLDLDNSNDAGGISSHVCYDPTSPPTTVAYNSTNTQTVGIAIEVIEASSGASGRPRRRVIRMHHLLVR